MKCLLHFPIFNFGNFPYGNMAHIRKPLLCKPHFISSSAHSHSQFAKIINRHNRSPQQYFIVPVAAVE